MVNKLKMENKKKAQSLSADILIVVVILLFGVLFLVMNKISSVENEDVNQKFTQAETETRIVYETLLSNGIINSDKTVNTEVLLSLNHDEIKSQLGMENDFAIVFEKDGKLIKIDAENDINCIGSEKILVNDKNCR